MEVRMSIPAIHVGCGPFSMQRLQIIIDHDQFDPVACVDIDIDKAKTAISKLKGDVPQGLADRTYRSIKEAIEKNKAEACFIFVHSKEHAKLVMESLNLGLHTYCIKAMACNQEEFKEIMRVHRTNPNLMLIHGYNNQWNEAATKMREWLTSENGIGKMIGGECLCWGRQNLKTTPPQADTTIEGLYFHALACHQLSQLVAAKGLPEYVTAYMHDRSEPSLDFHGVWGTAGGQCIFEYPGGVPFSYTGTRTAHGNPFGFASRWSGQWMIHGENGDIRREGGRLTLYRDGGPVQDYYLKDLDGGIIEDERIQIDAFYKALTSGENRDWLQESSLDTWILMEACNESARRSEKVSVLELKSNLMEIDNVK